MGISLCRTFFLKRVDSRTKDSTVWPPWKYPSSYFVFLERPSSPLFKEHRSLRKKMGDITSRFCIPHFSKMKIFARNRISHSGYTKRNERILSSFFPSLLLLIPSPPPTQSLSLPRYRWPILILPQATRGKVVAARNTLSFVAFVAGWALRLAVSFWRCTRSFQPTRPAWLSLRLYHPTFLA